MDARATYSARVQHWRSVAARAERDFARLGWARVATLAAGALMAWFAFREPALDPWWLAAPTVLFLVLGRRLDAAGRRRDLASRALAHFEMAFARMDDAWAGKGTWGENFRDTHHVYAEDLDLFGRGSLFELLCTARTTSGEQMLAAWLLKAAGREEALARQAALGELAPRVDLREEFALLGEDARSGVHSEAVAKWGADPGVIFPAWTRPAAWALAGINALTLGGFFAGYWSGTVVLSALAPALALAYLVREQTSQALAKVRSSSRDLQILAHMFARLEQERFGAPRLVRLREQLRPEGRLVSSRIAQLARIVVWIDSCNHLIVATLAPFLALRPQLAMAVERWRAQNGPHIAQWVAVLAEIEALNSLAAFTFEHPSAHFPELLADATPRFEARELRHPLLPAQTSVPNDVSLGGDLRLVIVSGSNMSGKSTLLRAVGLNCVLAWAGAPVLAGSLRISPLALGGSLRTVDSLQEGRSRFYAEILRLRQILDLTEGARPVLFLLDELLSGTNSHDRRIGAEGVIQGLIERGAAGMVTTHDLALVKIADALGHRATNWHFEDHLEEGKISFDYKLRPGVVQRSNALELMRAVGLKV